MSQQALADRLKKAFDAHAAGDGETAYAECRGLLRQDNRLAGAHYLMGLIQLDRGEPRKAIDALKQALATGPDNPALRMALGRAYRDGGALAMAVVEFENAAHLAPGYGEALHALGMARLDVGDFAGAVQALAEVAELDPENAAILAAYGIALRAAGRAADAASLFGRAVKLAPESPRLLSNWGVALMEAGRTEEALPALLQAVKLEESSFTYRRNLGLGLMAAGRAKAAADLFEALLEEEPDDIQLMLDLAGAMGRSGEDVVPFLTDLTGEITDEPRLWYALAEAYRAQGRLDDAIDAYDRCLELDGDDRLGATLGLALCGADPAPPAPPPAYVAQLFDDYAGRFDSELTGRLGYCGPELLKNLLTAAEQDRQFACTYDLGCGTGLMGPLLREKTSRLVGVDLSAKMVEQARQRGVYDELAVAEITGWLRGQKILSADLIVAADVLVYLGDLQPFFEAARRALSADGVLLFSLEADADPQTEYRLHDGHRYTHGAAAVQTLLTYCGFTRVSITPASTRQNQGVPVPGLLVLAGSPPPAAKAAAKATADLQRTQRRR
jgi:predicted TPR repeat methyltransferase